MAKNNDTSVEQISYIEQHSDFKLNSYDTGHLTYSMSFVYVNTLVIPTAFSQ